jgi:hypothetical protein
MDDDASSVSSYMDGIPPPPGAAPRPWDMRETNPDTILKINGKVPEVLHVLEYVGARRRLLHGKFLSFQPLHTRQSLI